MCVDHLVDTIWVVIKVEHGGVLGITQQMSTFATTGDVRKLAHNIVMHLTVHHRSIILDYMNHHITHLI